MIVAKVFEYSQKNLKRKIYLCVKFDLILKDDWFVERAFFGIKVNKYL
jgi:hypothetical protein